MSVADDRMEAAEVAPPKVEVVEIPTMFDIFSSSFFNGNPPTSPTNLSGK